MTTPISPSAKAAGFWSAVLATVFSLAYVVGQLAEWLGWLGSRGGPESGSTVLGIAVALVGFDDFPYGMMRMGRVALEHEGITSEVFREEPQARKWLLQDPS